MAKIIFLPEGQEIEVKDDSKILVAAVKAKVNLRYGCGALRCGTCAVIMNAKAGRISEMSEEERQMLERLSKPTDGSYRMTCKTKVLEGTVTLDLDSQD